jgi:hypothetical protein
MRLSLISVLALTLSAAACGDDDSGSACGPGTVSQNGVCVPAADTNVVADTSSPADTSAPADTNTAADTGTNTGSDTSTTVDTFQQETVSTECTPEEADKGFVGAPCTKDCQCQQNVKGQPLFCYKGFYMEGFSFCTDYAGNRSGLATLSEFDGVETIQFSSDCFPDVPPAERTKPLYVKACTSLDDCKAIGSAYDMCGTTGLPYSPGSSGTYCPTASGSNRTLTLNDTCVVSTVAPFDGGSVD